jgi:hypothetical protein
MAQAPQQGGGGAPRQNKTVKQFQGMNTQNRRNAIPEGSFSWLENIQPIGPGNLHSIPGRGASVTVIPPPTSCFPPAQTLTEVAYLASAYDTAHSPLCASRAFVQTASGGETIIEFCQHSAPSANDVLQIVNGVVTELGVPAWVDAANIGTCPNFLSGTGDRQGFLNGLGGARLSDYDLGFQSPAISWAGSNTDPTTATRRCWGQKGNIFYAGWATNNVSPNNGPCVTSHNATTGAWIAKAVAPYDQNVWRAPVSVHPFGSNVYYLFNHYTTPLTPPVVDTILVYDLSLSLVTSFDLADPRWTAMYVVSDDLIYLIGPAIAPPGMGSYVDVHYVKNILTTPVEVTLCENILMSPGDAVDVGQNFVLYSGLIGTQRFLYYGQDFNAAIHKIGPINC